MADTNEPQITLYSSKVSDCSARLRLALNLKGIPYRLVSVSMTKKENQTPEYSKLNPSQTVPTLVIERGGLKTSFTQSIAALEYLEEAFPNTRPLLPPLDQPEARAQVRSLLQIIATDIHPLTTPRAGRKIAAQFPGSEVSRAVQDSGEWWEWDTYWISRGLEAYENATKHICGKYSVGDDITLADVVLMPELWTGFRMGVDIPAFQNVFRIFRNLSFVELIRKEQSEPES